MRILHAIIRVDSTLSTLNESKSDRERNQRASKRAYLPMWNLQANDRSYTRMRERTKSDKINRTAGCKTLRNTESCRCLTDDSQAQDRSSRTESPEYAACAFGCHVLGRRFLILGVVCVGPNLHRVCWVDYAHYYWRLFIRHR